MYRNYYQNMPRPMAPKAQGHKFIKIGATINVKENNQKSIKTKNRIMGK